MKTEGDLNRHVIRFIAENDSDIDELIRLNHHFNFYRKFWQFWKPRTKFLNTPLESSLNFQKKPPILEVEI